MFDLHDLVGGAEELFDSLGLVACVDRSAGPLRAHARQRRGRRRARMFFAVSRQDMALLHGFIKKTQATPRKELMLAQRRMKEYDRHV